MYCKNKRLANGELEASEEKHDEIIVWARAADIMKGTSYIPINQSIEDRGQNTVPIKLLNPWLLKYEI